MPWVYSEMIIRHPDGTGVRDYIHVVDLAIGHVKAIEENGSTEKVSASTIWEPESDTVS